LHDKEDGEKEEEQQTIGDNILGEKSCDHTLDYVGLLAYQQDMVATMKQQDNLLV
jgi:hypothetical protein